jgi:hypothetical protein
MLIVGDAQSPRNARHDPAHISMSMALAMEIATGLAVKVCGVALRQIALDLPWFTSLLSPP